MVRCEDDDAFPLRPNRSINDINRQVGSSSSRPNEPTAQVMENRVINLLASTTRVRERTTAKTQTVQRANGKTDRRWSRLVR